MDQQLRMHQHQQLWHAGLTQQQAGCTRNRMSAAHDIATHGLAVLRVRETLARVCTHFEGTLTLAACLQQAQLNGTLQVPLIVLAAQVDNLHRGACGTWEDRARDVQAALEFSARAASKRQ